MRKIPVEPDGTKSNYLMQLWHLLPDLWVYLWSDTRLQWQTYLSRFTWAENFSLRMAESYGWLGVLFAMPITIPWMALLWVFAFISTIWHDLLFTFYVVFRKLEFVPADEMIRREFEKK